jgi:hypothetical protein
MNGVRQVGVVCGINLEGDLTALLRGERARVGHSNVAAVGTPARRAVPARMLTGRRSLSGWRTMTSATAAGSVETGLAVFTEVHDGRLPVEEGEWLGPFCPLAAHGRNFANPGVRNVVKRSLCQRRMER